MRAKTIYSILKEASEIPQIEQRRKFLRDHDSQPLRLVFKYALDTGIEWLLPEGDPPYKINEEVDAHGNLFSNIRKLYLFVKGGNDNLTKLKREMLFIQLLETVHPDDAKLLLCIKDKKLPFRFNPAFVAKTFPGLLSQHIKENEPEE
jgi:hypothetical protein